MIKSTEERAKKATQDYYNCNYPCDSFDYCRFGNGENTAFDCEECGADDFQSGYISGATDQLKADKEKVYHSLEKIVSKEVLEELIKIMEEQI